MRLPGNDKYDDGNGQGGIKIGPLGQRFDSPYASGALASAPLTTKQVRGNKQTRGKQAPVRDDGN
jgi:hypothetical protein